MADNNATLEQVDAFLKEFQAKAKVFGINYNIDKEENQQTLFDLEIPASKRDEYILSLNPEDYYQGPDVNDYDPEEDEAKRYRFISRFTSPRLMEPLIIVSRSI